MKQQLNLYPITYFGNKYKETKKYLFDIDYTKYNLIIEPFGGIYGFSRAIYNKCNTDALFMINDIDCELIKVHNFFKINQIKTITDKINSFCEKYKIFDMNDCDFRNFVKNYNEHKSDEYLFLKFQLIGLHIVEKLKKRINKTLSNLLIYKNFFERCTFYNMENKAFLEMIDNDKNFNEKKKLIFFDPPYFVSCNKSYICAENNTIDGNKIIIADNTKIYIDILEQFRKKEDCLMIINGNYLVEYLYKEFIKNKFKKIYSTGTGKKRNMKRVATHIILNNFK